MSTPQTPPKRLPRHGTRARYRLEIKPGPDGVKGKPCDPCKEANRKAAAAARANRTATARRGRMHLVDEPPADTIADTSADTIADTPPAAGDREPGPMEKAILEDIAEIPDDMKVPMHRSLEVLAIGLAHDFDVAEGHTARRAASSQLNDVIKSLRTRREGDGATALDGYLEDFGSGPPSVSGRPA